MRTVTYGAACSLDGFIAGRDSSIDWLHFSPDVHAETTRFWKTVDTVLMGRKTWDVAAARGGGGWESSSRIRTYVFSRTLTESPTPEVQLVSDDAGTFVCELKQREGKGICVMGGGDLARSLFEAGVVDEVGLKIHPVLLGSGIPMFLDAGRLVNLKLLECRTIDGGCLLALYRVSERARASAPRG